MSFTHTQRFTGLRNCRLIRIRRRQLVLWRWFALCLFEDQVDLRHLEPGDGDVEVEVFELQQIIEFDCQCWLVPAGIFSQFVVGDDVGPDLFFGHLIEANRRHFGNAKQLRRLYSPMSGDDAILSINQHWIRKSEDPNAFSNLPNLMLRVRSGIVRTRCKIRYWLVYKCLVFNEHMLTTSKRQCIRYRFADVVLYL